MLNDVWRPSGKFVNIAFIGVVIIYYEPYRANKNDFARRDFVRIKFRALLVRRLVNIPYGRRPPRRIVQECGVLCREVFRRALLFSTTQKNTIYIDFQRLCVRVPFVGVGPCKRTVQKERTGGEEGRRWRRAPVADTRTYDGGGGRPLLFDFFFVESTLHISVQQSCRFQRTIWFRRKERNRKKDCCADTGSALFLYVVYYFAHRLYLRIYVTCQEKIYIYNGTEPISLRPGHRRRGVGPKFQTRHTKSSIGIQWGVADHHRNNRVIK